MKRLALISDIHGNGVALDAVLAELTRWRVDEIICLGDVAVGGPQPQAVIARLRELDCRSVRGNAEGWLLDGLPPGRSEETRRLGEIVAWTRAALGRDDLEYLAGLPPTLPAWAEYALVEMDGGDVRIFLKRVAVKVETLAAASAAMPHASWATDLERRIRRWNARAR